MSQVGEPDPPVWVEDCKTEICRLLDHHGELELEELWSKACKAFPGKLLRQTVRQLSEQLVADKRIRKTKSGWEPLIVDQPQQRLFAFLKTREAQAKTFTATEAATFSRLSESSVKTYFSKKLKGRWVFSKGGRFEARGLNALSWSAFSAVMTQKAPERSSSEAAWRADLERLLGEGAARGFDVPAALDDLATRFAKK